MTEEAQRHVREHMTEEELVIFDILTRPAPELSPDERAEVKKVARELLLRLKHLLVLNWRPEIHCPLPIKARHRRCPGLRPAPRLFPRNVSDKMLRRLRACV